MQGDRAMVFIDFWNFQLQWNKRAPAGVLIDWPRVPEVLLPEAQTRAKLASLSYEGTRVYASIDRTNPKEANLSRWLDTFLDRQAGFQVFHRDRQVKQRPVRCRACGNEQAACPQCEAPYARSVEKGVDAALVSDLLTMAWEGVYDVALLLTSDADFVPAVEVLQKKGFKVINATWRGHGFELAKKSWASFELDALIKPLTRSPR